MLRYTSDFFIGAFSHIRGNLPVYDLLPEPIYKVFLSLYDSLAKVKSTKILKEMHKSLNTLVSDIYVKVTLYEGRRVIKAKKTRLLCARNEKKYVLTFFWDHWLVIHLLFGLNSLLM
jgi:hypothetical protein